MTRGICRPGASSPGGPSPGGPPPGGRPPDRTLPGAAVVLAGGRSRRLGRDKAELPWEGRTLLEVVAARLAGLFGEVVVVGGVRRRRLGLPRVSQRLDLLPGRGPLGGLVTGLLALPGRPVFACACDLPLLDPEAVRRLAAVALPALERGHGAVIPLVAGRRQFLHAFYGPRALAPLLAHLLAGRRRFGPACAESFPLLVDAAAGGPDGGGRGDPAADPVGRSSMGPPAGLARSCLDVDTAADLRLARQLSRDGNARR